MRMGRDKVILLVLVGLSLSEAQVIKLNGDLVQLTFENDFDSKFPTRVCAINCGAFKVPRGLNRTSIFTLDKINPEYCSHLLLHNGAGIVDGSMSITIPDSDWEQDVKELRDKAKGQGSNLKIILSIGGWDEGVKNFQDVSRNYSKLSKFTDSVASYLRDHDFIQGINIAWMWPGVEYRGGEERDKTDLIHLIQALRTATSNKAIITLLIPGDAMLVSKHYSLDKLSSQVDMMLLLAQDYSGNWHGVSRSGHHTPWSKVNETLSNSILPYVPASKIIVGIPFFGRTFILQNEAKGSGNGGFNESLSNGIFPARFHSSDIELSYAEICFMIRRSRKNLEIYLDQDDMGMFAVERKKWVSFEGVLTMKKKLDFVKEMGLGGVMGWTVELDDYEGSYCGGKDDKGEWSGLLTGFRYRGKEDGNHNEVGIDKLGVKDDDSDKHEEVWTSGSTKCIGSGILLRSVFILTMLVFMFCNW